MGFAPGEKWSYSNTGYVLLGIIIHRVTGEFYGDFLQARIFRPLGMASTQIISEADIVPHRSSGYRLVKGQLKNQEWVSPSLNTTADGALYTNVLDLAKWDAALYTTRLIRQSSFDLDLMWSPVKPNDGKTYPYGFGWGLASRGSHKVVIHDGAWQGFTMSIARYLDDRLTVIVMTNLDSDNSKPEKIAGCRRNLLEVGGFNAECGLRLAPLQKHGGQRWQRERQRIAPPHPGMFSGVHAT